MVTYSKPAFVVWEWQLTKVKCTIIFSLKKHYWRIPIYLFQIFLFFFIISSMGPGIYKTLSIKDFILLLLWPILYTISVYEKTKPTISIYTGIGMGTIPKWFVRVVQLF